MSIGVLPLGRAELAFRVVDIAKVAAQRWRSLFVVLAVAEGGELAVAAMLNFQCLGVLDGAPILFGSARDFRHVSH